MVIFSLEIQPKLWSFLVLVSISGEHTALPKIWFGFEHGLRTPNEGINQRHLKCFGRMTVTENLVVGYNSWPGSAGHFLIMHPSSTDAIVTVISCKIGMVSLSKLLICGLFLEDSCCKNPSVGNGWHCTVSCPRINSLATKN